MKSFLLPVFLCFPFLSNTQISFEFVNSPNDFSIGAVRKSPMGEYFVQAANDEKNIYTSLNGVDWVKTSLPVGHELYDIQFYSDGTPVLKPDRDEHLIRRDGNWYTMNAGGGDLVEASFIKDDTLFIYHDDSFAYSLDMGQTFITIFTYEGNLIDHTAQLWKFESHFVLHHTAGTQDRLSVFNFHGDRVLSDTLELNFNTSITYSSCGYVLFNDMDNYYLLKEDDLVYQSGPVTDIMPSIGYDTYVQLAGDQLYLRDENTIYRTLGCDLIWEYLMSDELIEFNENIWFSHEGGIFLFNTNSDFFIVGSSGTWKEHYPDINHPHTSDVDEAANGHQITLTSNALFSKRINDELWMELDSSGSLEYQIQYAPGGGLYIARENDILYSMDNGHSFSSIPFPSSEYPIHHYFLEVLDDNILFFILGLFGQGFYTLNNGQDWISTDLYFQSETPQVKLVGNEILIADFDYKYVFAKINVVTNDTATASFDRLSGTLGAVATILDDGTFYYRLEFIFGNDAERYYRFRFGEGVDYLGPFPDLGSHTLASSGNHFYAFGPSDYCLFNGETFVKYGYESFPYTGSKKFIISENEYLYAIVDRHKIYRSTQPLSLQTSTKQANVLGEFNVFPNPTNEVLSVRFAESSPHSIDSYEIVDQVGQVLYQSAFLHRSNIRVAQLAPGLYNLVLKDNGVIVGINKFVRL